MAAVMASYSSQRPTSPNKSRPSKHQSGKSGAPAPSDIYYGHEETAKMCARFISALFSCPDTPPAPSVATNPPAPSPSLAVFIAYALHRTRLHSSVTFSALFLLSRLKSRFPAARGSSGHRLFISAFMIASKVVCDDTYSNKSWCVVGQAMFSLKEINQMEREMCSYLEWILHVEAKELQEFETRVRRDYGAGGPAPSYVPVTPPSTRTATSPAVAAAAAPAPTSPTRVPPPRTAAHDSYPSPVSTPPSPSLSNNTSPASSTCHTPPATDDPNAVIVAPGSTHPMHQSVGVVVKTKSPDVASARHRESAFAFAAPTVW